MTPIPSTLVSCGHGHKPGSIDWWTDRSELPSGPATAGGLFRWPDHVVEVLLQIHDARLRLQAHIDHGLQLHTQYSGKGTGEAAFAKLGKAVQTVGGIQFKSNCWRVETAVDSKKLAQRVLAAHSDDSRPSHIFGDLDTFLAPGRKSELDSLMPIGRASPAAKGESYTKMMDALLKDLKNSFSNSVKCALHGDDGCAADELLVGSHDLPRNGELSVWAAGTSCVNFSKRGKRECAAGASMRPWTIWVALVRRHKPHLVMHEITISKQALAMLYADLGDLYFIYPAHVSPVDIGWPCDRPRQICLLTLRGSVTFVGHWRHWFELFGRQVNISAVDMLAAPPEYTRSVEVARARAHGHHFSDDQAVPIECCLSACQFKHHQLYVGMMSDNAGPDGSFCYDVEQHPDYNLSCPFLPTLISHGTIVVNTPSTILGGKQHLVAMGEPVFSAQQLGHSYTSSFHDLLCSDVLAESALKELAGNAFHEAVFGMMLAYALAFTTRDSCTAAGESS